MNKCDKTITERYPRLIAALQWVACLSWGEAVTCIRDYQEGRDYSGEAVNHFGGTRETLERASRAWVRGLVVDQRRHERERVQEVSRGLR